MSGADDSALVAEVGDDVAATHFELARAGINVGDHFNRVEVYGRTLADARSLRDRILTALRDDARQPADGWRPIEEAPRDGRPLALFDPEHCDDEMNPWLNGHWTDGAHEDKGGFQAAVWDNSQDYFATVGVNPTHFSVLNPTTTEGKGA